MPEAMTAEQQVPNGCKLWRFAAAATLTIASLGAMRHEAAYADDSEALPLPPGAAVCALTVSRPGEVAIANGTPVEAMGNGYAAMRSSDAPSNNMRGSQAVSNWNFGQGSVDPNLAFAEVGLDSRICVDNSQHSIMHMILDHAGSMPADVYTPAAEDGAKRLIDTRIGLVLGGISVREVLPGVSVCADAVGEPGTVAVVNITPVEAEGSGFGAIRSSDTPSNNTLGDQMVSNVNFSQGTVDPNVAFVEIGSDNQICFDNSEHARIQLILDQMGSLKAGAFKPAQSTGAKRIIDTRRGLVNGGASVIKVGPGQSVCADVAGEPGDNEVLNLTPVEAAGSGYAAIRSSDAPSNNTLGGQAVSNANFAQGTVDPNVAISEIGADGKVCVENSEHSDVQFVVDDLGTIPAESFSPAQGSGAMRIIDTRRGLIRGGEIIEPDPVEGNDEVVGPNGVIFERVDPPYLLSNGYYVVGVTGRSPGGGCLALQDTNGDGVGEYNGLVIPCPA